MSDNIINWIDDFRTEIPENQLDATDWTLAAHLESEAESCLQASADCLASGEHFSAVVADALRRQANLARAEHLLTAEDFLKANPGAK